MDQEIETDLSAEPLPRWQLDLLWIGAEMLGHLRVLTTMPGVEVIPAGSISDADDEGRRMIMLLRMIKAGEITTADVDWAIDVDRLGGEAETRYHAGDLVGAIEKFREGLRQAPGADVYLMSMASCFVTLGAPPVALRYLERAHAINPGLSRLRENLDGARRMMGMAAAETARPTGGADFFVKEKEAEKPRGFWKRLFG